MKTPTSIFTLILSLACGGFLTADIVRMKNGTVVMKDLKFA